MFVLGGNYQCGCGMEGRIQAFIYTILTMIGIEYDLIYTVKCQIATYKRVHNYR